MLKPQNWRRERGMVGGGEEGTSLVALTSLRRVVVPILPVTSTVLLTELNRTHFVHRIVILAFKF